VQSGVGGDRLAAICMFIGPGSLYVLGLWSTSRSTSPTFGPHGGFLPYGVARSPSGADQRRSTNMTSKFQ